MQQRRAAHGHDVLGIRIRQGLKEQAANDAERRRVRTDADRENPHSVVHEDRHVRNPDKP